MVGEEYGHTLNYQSVVKGSSPFLSAILILSTMKIKQVLWQNRRDFSAIMKCEFCGHEQKNESGYDDRYYHDNVIPNMKCKACDKSTVGENGIIENTPTKYPENFQI